MAACDYSNVQVLELAVKLSRAYLMHPRRPYHMPGHEMREASQLLEELVALRHEVNELREAKSFMIKRAEKAERQVLELLKEKHEEQMPAEQGDVIRSRCCRPCWWGNQGYLRCCCDSEILRSEDELQR